MDRFYYFQKLSQERQREISQELATRRLLKDAVQRPATVKHPGRLALRVGAVALVIGVVLLMGLSI